MKYKTLIILIMLLPKIAISEHFQERDSETLKQFHHNNGNSGQYYYPEIVGSGAALFDYDNDGDLDLYLVQSGKFSKNKEPDFFFKNLLMETGSLKFKNITQELDLNNTSYGIGISVADINHDGWKDFFLGNLEENQIFINQKGLGFKKFTLNEKKMFSTSATFCDINNDGYKDLYISNYVDWSEQNNPKCFNSSSKRDYCGPGSFKGQKDTFYLNQNGELIDKTSVYFPEMPEMPGLNAVCLDVNNDGWQDIIVANDGKPNLLWLNQKGQKFQENGLFSGLAVNSEGVSEASMGMAVGDYDIDGDADVFFTHLMNESNTLYNNNGKGYFRDVTNRTNLTRDSIAYTGWATGFIHANNDIYPDIIVFNGAVADSSQRNEKPSLKQSNQLFISSAGNKYNSVTKEEWLKHKSISRGAAFGDIDNDGDTDIVINNNNDFARILLNNLNPEQWLGIEMTSFRNFQVQLKNENKSYWIKNSVDASYASASDKRLTITKSQIDEFNKLIFTHNGKTLLEYPLKPSNTYIKLKLK